MRLGRVLAIDEQRMHAERVTPIDGRHMLLGRVLPTG